jgi:hypothetical protein
MLLTGVVAILASLTLAVASVAQLYAARTAAATAADAAALAAAVGTYPPAGFDSPGRMAAEMARANGARLLSCTCPVDHRLVIRTIEVVTAIDVEVLFFGEMTVEAAARAEFDPVSWLGVG